MDEKLIPIYTTPGDLGAFMRGPHLFNPQGEYIGFVTPEREVYNVMGYYVGYLADGPRILRKRMYSFDRPKIQAPPFQEPIRVPAHAPLPPMMSEITYSDVDILDEEPERLVTRDASEFLKDID